MMLMVVMVMMISGLVTNIDWPHQQRLRLLGVLTSPGLLQVQHRLLYGENQEESDTHDEMGQRVFNINVVSLLYFFADLEQIRFKIIWSLEVQLIFCFYEKSLK